MCTILFLQAVCKVLKMKEKVQVTASHVELREIGEMGAFEAGVNATKVNSVSDMATIMASRQPVAQFVPGQEPTTPTSVTYQ